MIGRHSVIESPDSVSRVRPPMTTMTKIMAQQASSQSRRARLAAMQGVMAVTPPCVLQDRPSREDIRREFRSAPCHPGESVHVQSEFMDPGPG